MLLNKLVRRPARPASPSPARKPRLSVEPLEGRSLMAAGALADTQGIFAPWPDYDLTAHVAVTPQGRGQFYVDGSDYEDRITVLAYNAGTQQLTLRLEQ